MRYLVIIFLIINWGCSKGSDNDSEIKTENLYTTVQYKNIDNVNPELLSLDIYYNNIVANKKPVIIWVHGGGWCIGDKLNQIDNKVNLFRSLGYILVSVNYRLSPYPYKVNNDNRLKYPIHNNDVADAIRWVTDNINRYGGDKDNIVLLGHSAGAHLVSLTGTNSIFLESVGLNLNSIKGVAAIDTEGYDVLEKVQQNNNMYINAFGTDINTLNEASPIFNIKDGVTYPKFFIAKRGTVSRIAIADNFISKLSDKGITVKQVDGSIYDHSGINRAIGEPNETLITNALKDFLKECFK